MLLGALLSRGLRGRQGGGGLGGMLGGGGGMFGGGGGGVCLPWATVAWVDCFPCSVVGVALAIPVDYSPVFLVDKKFLLFLNSLDGNVGACLL